MLISVLAVAGIVFIFAAGLASGLLIVTLVGIPLLALVVMSGRAWNRLYRALARLTGAAIDAPPPFARPTGRLQTVAGALTDAVGWRSLGFLALRRRADDADRLRRDRRRRNVRRVGGVAGGVAGDGRAVRLASANRSTRCGCTCCCPSAGVVALYSWVG